MSEYAVPAEVQSLLFEKVEAFNKKNLANKDGKYAVWIRGKFIYLDYDYGDENLSRVGRLTYNDDIKKMDFAIFKYSNEKYSFDEYYPGQAKLNGTIEGAMKAGLIAYPI